MRRAREIVASVLALAGLGSALAGCGEKSLEPSDAHFIDAFSDFSSPVRLTLPLDSSGLAGGGLPIYGVPRACIFSRLADTGVIRISPSTAGPPWWKAETRQGMVTERAISIPVGRREAQDRTNEQTQEDGDDRYYAATYSYVIHPTGAFVGPSSPTLGPFELNVSFFRDHTVGQWAPYARTAPAAAPAPAADAAPSSGDQDATPPAPAPLVTTPGIPIDQMAELTALMSRVFPTHACADTIEARTAPARGAAFAAIEGQLAQRGLVAKGPEPAVLTSSASGLTWYAGLVKLDGRTLADLPGVCAKLPAKGVGPWRPPSGAEMKTLIATDKALGQLPGRFFDVPDHRLFAAAITTEPKETLRFLTSGSAPAPNRLSYFDAFEYSGFNGGLLERPVVGQSPQAVRLSAFDRVLCVSKASPPIQNGPAPAA